MAAKRDIQVITAPSILGLKPTGVEHLAASLLSNGLLHRLSSPFPLIAIPVLNEFYSAERESRSVVLNQEKLHEFSVNLRDVLHRMLETESFSLVLGGDCSILIGAMAALHAKGKYGLFFLDAHADFYAPGQTPTGEAADMDLAIVSGRGPDTLANIDGGRPYVEESNIIHIGQRDWKETRQYGSDDIKQTSITCIDNEAIQYRGVEAVCSEIARVVAPMNTDGYWIHFDTDVISDDENPAVDYRLEGGLTFQQCTQLLQWLLEHYKIVGMTVTIFNPKLDKDGTIAEKIVDTLTNALGK